jgi:DNA-binding IclR family transcriptional regulator
VAAPVFDDTGHLVAALSVSGPCVRCDTESLVSEVAPRVSAAAGRLSSELGYTS